MPMATWPAPKRSRAEILAAGGSAEAIAFDVADGNATRAAIEGLLEAGPIQVVVNNAGIHDDAPMAGMSRGAMEARDRRLAAWFLPCHPAAAAADGAHALGSHRQRFIGRRRARQPRPDQLRRGQGRAAWRLEIAGARNGHARHHRQRGRARRDRGQHGRRGISAGDDQADGARGPRRQAGGSRRAGARSCAATRRATSTARSSASTAAWASAAQAASAYQVAQRRPVSRTVGQQVIQAMAVRCPDARRAPASASPAPAIPCAPRCRRCAA